MSALFYDTLAAIWISIAGVDARWGHLYFVKVGTKVFRPFYCAVVLV